MSSAWSGSSGAAPGKAGKGERLAEADKKRWPSEQDFSESKQKQAAKVRTEQ